MHRVLKSGGRLSLYEPINSFGGPEPENVLWGFDMSGLDEVVAKVKDARTRLGDQVNRAMLDFDERDLLMYACDAGFSDVHLEYRAEVGTTVVQGDVETFLRTAPNPLVPPLIDVLRENLDHAELSGVVERLSARWHTPRRHSSAGAYLWATK